MTNVIDMLLALNREDISINQKRNLAGGKPRGSSCRGFSVGTSMKGFKSHIQVLLARVHGGTQKASLNTIFPFSKNGSALCRQSSLQRYIFDKKQIACNRMVALCFCRFACPNKSTHKFAINVLPFIFCQCSQRSACSILGDIC